MFKFIKNIFKPKFVWKYIDLDAEVLNEIKQVCINNLPDYSNGTYFAQILDVELPLIRGKQVVSAILIYIPGNNDTRFAHRDPPDYINNSNTYALNIPLINSENSRTTLYKDRKPFFIPAKISAYPPKNASIVEIQAIYKAKHITSYLLDRPILFDTQIFHAVHNTSTDPSIFISLRFAENPVEWI